jgi:3-hydroxyacyl-[acyl-carrier protein] dehydratase / trans-2-decenoyl-[acyl-carrier protein] isomerase
MKYNEFINRTSFTKEELIAFSWGHLVDDPPSEFAKLPAPPFLMIDRVTHIEKNGKKGKIIAEKDVRVDDWFFQCHFVGDPVQPGVLGVDAIWQLIGFYCTVNGAPGSGRALGCGQVEFSGQIRPHNKIVRYEIDIRRYSAMSDQGAVIAIGNARVFVDDEQVYIVNDARAGLFTGVAYADYPMRSMNSVGGIMSRDA